MKKAPKRFGYKYGSTINDPKKARPNVPNTAYPTAAEQMAAAGLINPTTAKIYASENEKRRYYQDVNAPSYGTSLQDAGTGTVNANARKVEITSTGLKMITNPDGSVQYLDQNGNPIAPLTKAEGGTVRRMMKAPKIGKRNC